MDRHADTTTATKPKASRPPARKKRRGERVRRAASARGRGGPQAKEALRPPPLERALAARRPHPSQPRKKLKYCATDNIVENDSESRSTRPPASLSWRSRAALPCRRLPRRHSCRSPAQPKQSTPPRLHAARGCVVASGKSKNPKPAGHGPAKSSQEPPQSTANTASKPLCCLRAICWRRLLREETAASGAQRVE